MTFATRWLLDGPMRRQDFLSSVRINLRFCMKVYPIGIIYIYYHAKSGCYSFKIGQVMATSKLWNTFVYPSTLWCTWVHPSTL